MKIMDDAKAAGIMNTVKMLWGVGKKFLTPKYVKLVKPHLEAAAIAYFNELQQQYPGKDIIFAVVPNDGKLFYTTGYFHDGIFTPIATFDPANITELIKSKIDGMLKDKNLKIDSISDVAATPIS